MTPRRYAKRPKEQIREILILALSDLRNSAERDTSGLRHPRRRAPRPYMVFDDAVIALECALKAAPSPELSLALFAMLLAWDRRESAGGSRLFSYALDATEAALKPYDGGYK